MYVHMYSLKIYKYYIAQNPFICVFYIYIYTYIYIYIYIYIHIYNHIHMERIDAIDNSAIILSIANQYSDRRNCRCVMKSRTLLLCCLFITVLCILSVRSTHIIIR